MAEEAKEQQSPSEYWWNMLTTDLKDAYIEGVKRVGREEAASTIGDIVDADKLEDSLSLFASMYRLLLDNPNLLEDISRHNLKEQELLKELGKDAYLEKVKANLTPRHSR